MTMLRYFLIFLLIASGISASSQPYKNEWIDYNKTYYKFAVKDEGLFRIPKTVLDNLNLGTVNAEDFQLWRDGKEQTIYTSQPTGPLTAGGYIEFYGRPLDGTLDTELFPNPANHVYKDLSFFSDTAWYYLTVNPGVANARFINETNTVATTTLPVDSFFMKTNSINFFRGGFSYNYSYGYGIYTDSLPSQNVIRSSVWDAGEGFAGTPFDGNQPFKVAFNSLQLFKNGPAMQLSMSIIGSWAYNRNITVDINDSVLTSVYIPNFQLRKQVINNIPLSRVTNDATTVKFTSDNPNWPERSQVNALMLTYPRKFHFANSRVYAFQLPANANGNHLRISNFLFGAQPALLLDLTNKRRYLGVTKVDSSLFALQPSATDRDLVVVNQADFLRQVTSIAPIQFTDYSKPANQGDYLIITSKRIMFDGNGKNQVDEYKQYRGSALGGGYNVKVIDVEELYDQFSLGIRKNPLSIKHFIQYAVNNFAVKPKFVVLIGRGVDYLGDRYSGNYANREYLNSVPTWGSPASDNLLASANSLDPTPLVPIGRISVVNGKEIGDYLDKVKEFEALNASPDFSPEKKEWKKEAIQLVGGDDVFFSSILSNFMNGYKKIISDTMVGANVKTYVRVKNPNYSNDVKEMTNRINDGVGLITYFGHSSSSSIDFNLNAPDDYTNKDGKYPVFIANGCRAGNLFTLNSYRMSYYGQSISERFILSPHKGAIAFISNSDLGLYNYLNIFTQEWMKSAAKNNYGYGIGIIQQQAVKNAIAITGPTEFFNRMNLEEVVLHGDPAVVIFPNLKPDYVTTDTLLSVKPLNATVAEDTLVVKAKFLNLGKAIKDSVWVDIKREFPDGRELSVTKVLLRKLQTADSIQVKIPVAGLFDKGTNYITATIDPANEWDEMSESNNIARIPFEVSDEEIRPVFPYNYSIVNQPGFHLIGSTVNAVQDERTYRLQVDTTEFFNSPKLFTRDTTTIGGAVDFLPAITWENGRVYYWRLAPVFNSTPVNWRTSSFQYLQGIAPGWGQSHFFQHTKSDFKKTSLDSASRNFKFGSNIQNLYLINSIYATSGDEDNHFSIQENGLTRIYSACVGQSIIFNVFDTLTFQPWYNPNQRYGSGYWCAWGREYNFEFPYFPASNRKKIMDFIDSIPKGMIVTARLILDPPQDSSFAKYWLKDTLKFGSGKSLYHSLYNQGFYGLDSLTKPRTWTFVFRKDDSTEFKPSYNLSAGVYDRLNNSYFVPTIDSVGEILSPKFGPAKSWKEMHWMGHQFQGINPDSYAEVQLIGIDKNDKTFVLKTYQPGTWDNDISDVDAALYPFLRLKLITKNATVARPYQLDYWRLFYDPVPDGALSALDYYVFNRPILVTSKDRLKIELAFKNVSSVPLDSCSVRITIGDRDGNKTVYDLDKLKPLNPGDTAIISFEKATDGMDGRYFAFIEVNREQVPLEQYSFNNSTYIPFEVVTTLAVMKLDFTATAEQAAVRLDWKVSNEYDIANYTLEHSVTNNGFVPLATFKSRNNFSSVSPYNWLHNSPALGVNYYRIKITYQSGKVEYSAVRQVNFSKAGVVVVYPNPFTERIAIASPGNQAWMVEMFNMQGQRLLNRNGSGSTNINTQQLPAGFYILKLTYGNKTTTLKLEKHH